MNHLPKTQPHQDERAQAEEALEKAARERPEEIKKDENARRIVEIPPVTEDTLVKGLDP